MKKYNQIVKVFAVFTALSVFFACSEDTMDNVNKNKNNPHDTQAKFLVADLLTNTAFSSVGGDFSLYASIYVEHETGVHNQMYNAETRNGEPSISTTYNNVWQSTYANVKHAKIIIEKCTSSVEEVGNEVTLGVAKVMLAYNAAILTDLFGDVPYFEAGEINPDMTPKYMQPKIDKQETIYREIFKLLDEAIVHFDGKDVGLYGALGNKDFIYGGNAAKWKKAAYALKARYTMRLLNRSADKTADLNAILDYVSKSFASADEEFKFDVYDGDATMNPLCMFSYSRDALGASVSLIEKFIERNDPRASQSFMNYYFEQVTDPDEIYSAENGSPQQSQWYYDLSIACYSLTAPTQLMSYHELLFLKAEALCRLNNNADAKEALKEAITAGLANQENTIISAIYGMEVEAQTDMGSDVADDYFANDVEPLFDTDPLQETMIQKYLSFFGASGESIEAYNDYRRLKAADEEFILLTNPKNATQFPLRFSYGVSDVTANMAIKEAYGDGRYVYTENIWWAGGTR